LSLPLLAGSASAECAWVMWVTTYRMSGDQPISEQILPSLAYTTKRECDEALERREKREDERRQRDPAKADYFACYPDTMDPRTPKGR
jgi:hypothetical protein